MHIADITYFIASLFVQIYYGADKHMYFTSMAKFDQINLYLWL